MANQQTFFDPQSEDIQVAKQRKNHEQNQAETPVQAEPTTPEVATAQVPDTNEAPVAQAPEATTGTPEPVVGPNVNKSEAIRNAVKANPNANAEDVVNLLATQGISVTKAMVYTIRSRKPTSSQRPRRAPHRQPVVTAGHKPEPRPVHPVEMVVQLRQIAESLGGMQYLKRFVEVL